MDLTDGYAYSFASPRFCQEVQLLSPRIRRPCSDYLRTPMRIIRSSLFNKKKIRFIRIRSFVVKVKSIWFCSTPYISLTRLKVMGYLPRFFNYGALFEVHD